MKKRVGIVKRLFTLLLMFLLSINSFAAIVSDNDGSAFITKAEFDALKSSFQAQIDDYNRSIDSKIDGAIASYLAGAKIGQTSTKDILYSGNDAEKITCMGDWDGKTKVGTVGTNVNLLAHTKADSGDKTGGILIELKYTHPAVNDGTNFMCDLLNQQPDGSYDDVVWNGYYDNMGTLISKTGVLDSSYTRSAAYATHRKGHFKYFYPTVSTGFYPDWNATLDVLQVWEYYENNWSHEQQWHVDVSYYDFLSQSVTNTQSKRPEYANVISWDRNVGIWPAVDDTRYVYIPNAVGIDGRTSISAWRTGTVSAYRCGVQGKGTSNSLYTFSTPNVWDDTPTGWMPVFGCIGPKNINYICVKNYTIYGKNVTLDKIKLIDGIPLFEGKKGDQVEWDVRMDDTDDYVFYFSHEKFDGVPDTSRCIKCTTNKSTVETTEPEIIGGKTTIRLTFTEDGVVWAKWKHKAALGNAVLNLQNCKTYKLTVG